MCLEGPGVLPGMLSRLIQAHLCIAVVKTSKMGHDIPLLGSLDAPVGSRRSREVPRMLRGTLNDVQETHQSGHKMKFEDSVASVPPHSFFRMSMGPPGTPETWKHCKYRRHYCDGQGVGSRSTVGMWPLRRILWKNINGFSMIFKTTADSIMLLRRASGAL